MNIQKWTGVRAQVNAVCRRNQDDISAISLFVMRIYNLLSSLPLSQLNRRSSPPITRFPQTRGKEMSCFVQVARLNAARLKPIRDECSQVDGAFPVGRGGTGKRATDCVSSKQINPREPPPNLPAQLLPADRPNSAQIRADLTGQCDIGPRRRLSRQHRRRSRSLGNERSRAGPQSAPVISLSCRVRRRYSSCNITQ